MSTTTLTLLRPGPGETPQTKPMPPGSAPDAPGGRSGRHRINLGCPATRSPGSTPAPPPPLMRCAKARLARMATAEAAG